MIGYYTRGASLLLAALACISPPSAIGGQRMDDVPSRMIEGVATFRMLFEGNAVGTAVYDVERTGDGWVLTETTEVPDFEVSAVSRVETTADLRPLRFTSDGTMFGGSLEIAVDFVDGHARGASVYPRSSGPERIDLDAVLPPGTLERTQLFFLIAALPHAEGSIHELVWYDTYFGQIQEIVAAATQAERIEVPVGTFDTWRVELRGGTPSQVVWVTRQAPHRLVRIEVVGQPWVYELISAEAR